MRLFLLCIFLVGSLGAAGVGLVEPAGAADDRDGQAQEWEDQVATDARGDVLVDWRGTVDLYYMTVGELYSVTLSETYLFIRIGYNITDNGDEDVEVPDTFPLLPPPFPQTDPELVPNEILTTINITFNISKERSERISLYSGDRGASWISNQGRLVAAAQDVRGHSEVLYFTPLRRFELESGDLLSDYNITGHRNHRITDTMQGFEVANDYAPNYFPVHPLVDAVANGDLVPFPVPLPGPPEPPVPLPEPPVPVPDAKDLVPNKPWVYPPSGPQGIPYGVPTEDELGGWDPTNADDRDSEPPPLDPERLGEDPSSAAARNHTHRVDDGTGRLVARAHQEVYTASFSHVAWANFTVENRFETIDQRVAMLVAGTAGTRWAFRYGLDMPLGVKELPAGGTIEMSMIGVPVSLFSASSVPATAIFLSDWGGIDVTPVTFFNTNEPIEEPFLPSGPGLPTSLEVDLLNPDDPFRVNEVRKIMVRVRTGGGAYVSQFDAVRAYVFPAGTSPEVQAPYQLREKPWMDGVYEVDFVFNKPGAWVVAVYFFDYPADRNGVYPSISFQVRVDYPGESNPIVPLPAALGSVGLLMLAVAARERMSKVR